VIPLPHARDGVLDHLASAGAGQTVIVHARAEQAMSKDRTQRPASPHAQSPPTSATWMAKRFLMIFTNQAGRVRSSGSILSMRLRGMVEKARHSGLPTEAQVSCGDLDVSSDAAEAWS
jgi:hypothetical protein